MKAALVCASLLVLSAGLARAQTDMSCADYLKADAQMQGQMSAADKAAIAKDPTATALDRKMRDYCAKNPRAPASEAMQKAMMD